LLALSEIAVTDNNKSNDIQEVKSDLQQPKMFSELLTSSTPKSEDQEHVDAENELQQPGLANISAEEYLRMRNLLAATENALHQAYERIDRLTNQKPASMGPTTDVLEGLENTLKLGVSVASIPLRVTNEQLKAPFDKETLSAKSALETYLQEAVANKDFNAHYRIIPIIQSTIERTPCSSQTTMKHS